MKVHDCISPIIVPSLVTLPLLSISDLFELHGGSLRFLLNFRRHRLCLTALRNDVIAVCEIAKLSLHLTFNRFLVTLKVFNNLAELRCNIFLHFN